MDQYEQFSPMTGAEFQRRMESMSRLLLCFFLAFFLMPILGMAQTSETIPGAKIAWMNLEQAIVTCDEGDKLFREIQKFVEDKNTELDTLRKEFESLRNQLSVQGPKLTDEARADLEDQVETKDTALQRFQQDTQKEIEGRRVRAANYIGKKMQPIIEKFSKEKGINAVIVYDPARDAWVDASLNVTQEIIEAYNKAYAVAASKTPAKAAPAKTP
jgi:Skp family chaperone for outer membrane proteins